MRLGLGLRLAALAPALVLAAPLQIIANRLGSPVARRIPRWFHRYAARILGTRITLIGAPHRDGGVLYVANHVSWLDILVISAVLPVSFIARADMASWPGFGGLARLQRSIFVDRDRRHSTGEVSTLVAERLASGDQIVLFAEGTTGDGHRVLPFRSALVGAARSDAEETCPPVPVQPLALAYLSRQGLPLSRRTMPDVAWFGDMALMPHLTALLERGPVDVVVSLGPAMTLAHAADRKRVAGQAEAWIRSERATLRRPIEEFVKRL